MSKLKVGLVECSQHGFSRDTKGQFMSPSAELEELSKEYGYELFVYPESVITEADAERAVGACEENNVDFIMLRCTSYSAGFVVPVIAKANAMGMGLWAISEDGENGVAQLNSCRTIDMYAGIFSHSRYTSKNNLKAKWFFGNKGDPQFDRQLALTIRTLTALKKLCNSKMALIGGIAPGFNDLSFGEKKLLDLFPGMKFERVHKFDELSDIAVGFDNQIAASCDDDVVNAVCMMLLNYLSGDTATIMDLISYDVRDESIFLWHCHPNSFGVMRDMVFKAGKATAFRLDAALDNNLIFSGNFMFKEKNSMKGSRGWMENLMLGNKPIGALDLTNTLLSKQFPNHYPVVYGDFTGELMELTMWLGLGLVENAPYHDYLQKQLVPA